MESINLANCQKQLPAELLKQAQKLVVRECDEEAGGRYVAYVDERENSFDVSLTVDKKGTVTAHDCDCGAGPQKFCSHRAALLVHIAEGTKTKAPKVAVSNKKKASTKKEPKWVSLLESAAEEDLRSFLKTQLTLSKVLELAFTHHFSAVGKVLSDEEIASATADAIKAVLGRKRNIEQRDMNAIVKLWTSLHRPILERYKSALADPECFAGIHAVTESCMVFYYSFGRGPGDIPAYIEKLLAETRPLMLQLKTTEAWETATGYFLSRLFNEVHQSWRLHYLLHIRALILEDTSGREQELLKRLADAFTVHATKKVFNSGSADAILFYLLRDKRQLLKYLVLFKPAHWAHDYNIDLAHEYIAQGQLQEAVSICDQQMNSNSIEEYNIPYLQLLKKLYTDVEDEKNKLKVMERLLPFDFNFYDFTQVYSNMETEAAKTQLRTKIMTKARHAWKDGNVAAIKFFFDLFIAESNPSKLIELIDEDVPYSLIAENIDFLVKAGKEILLKQLFKERHYLKAFGKANIPQQEEGMLQLYNALLQHFSREELRNALESYRIGKRQKYVSDNALVQYLNNLVWK